jgi:tetratricopeptide (TPR) repeat protein
MNQISFDIRRILPNVNEIIKPEDLIQNIHIDQFLQKADEINQLNLAKADDLTKDIYHLLKVDDNNLKGIGYACLSSIHTFNGNYKKAIYGINKALELNVNKKVYAYILIEYANLLRQLLRTDEALAVLNTVLDQTNDQKLKWRVITYQGYCYKYTNKSYSLELLNKAANHYADTQEYSRYSTILRHISLLHINYNEFDLAKNLLLKAKNIADHYQLRVILQVIRIDTGWLYIKEKKHDDARKIFLELLKEDLVPYTKSLVLQNLGVLEFELKNYKLVIDYYKKSLKINKEFEIYEMLFEDYYKLGLANERLGEYKNAKHYYSEGYEYLLEERKQLNIILLAGYRSLLLDNYIRFLSDLPSITTVREHPKTFEFTNGKTYKEILNFFQMNLLILHRKRENTIEGLCKKLNISLRLYFVYQKRFELSIAIKKSTNINNPHFCSYLQSMLSIDWHSAINKFDNDLYSFLLYKHKFSKSNIAKILGVSNLTVIKKTAKIT